MITEKIAYKLRLILGLKTRESLLRILPKHAVCAELGVFRGDFSGQILKYTQPAEAHFVDVWWTEFGEVFPDWNVYTNFGTLKTRDAYNDAKSKIEAFKCKSTIHVGSDLEFLSGMPDHYFDWVYIDSSHEYDHTVKELELLKNKLKPGGIICGHDWYDDENHKHYGVTRAVNEFCKAENWKLFYRDKYLQWAIKQNQ
jgi:SAM-dependent methyltransferase